MGRARADRYNRVTWAICAAIALVGLLGIAWFVTVTFPFP
jgi:hypothetical protein